MQNNYHVLTRLASVRFWGCAISAGCEGLKVLMTQKWDGFQVFGWGKDAISASRRSSAGCGVCWGTLLWERCSVRTPASVFAPKGRTVSYWTTWKSQDDTWQHVGLGFLSPLFLFTQGAKPLRCPLVLSVRFLGSNRWSRCTRACQRPVRVAFQLLLFGNWLRYLLGYLHLVLLPLEVECCFIVPSLHQTTLCCSQRILLKYFSWCSEISTSLETRSQLGYEDWACTQR